MTRIEAFLVVGTAARLHIGNGECCLTLTWDIVTYVHSYSATASPVTSVITMQCVDTDNHSVTWYGLIQPLLCDACDLDVVISQHCRHVVHFSYECAADIWCEDDWNAAVDGINKTVVQPECCTLSHLQHLSQRLTMVGMNRCLCASVRVDEECLRSSTATAMDGDAGVPLIDCKPM